MTGPRRTLTEALDTVAALRADVALLDGLVAEAARPSASLDGAALLGLSATLGRWADSLSDLSECLGALASSATPGTAPPEVQL